MRKLIAPKSLVVMVAMACAALFAVLLRILAMFYASRIIAGRVLRAMLLAIVLGFAAAGIHRAAMLVAMLLGAMMGVVAMMAAFFGGTARMVLAMGAMLGRIRAVFGANRIVAIRLLGAMLLAIVLADGLVFAMFDTRLAFFTLGFFAMFYTVVLDGFHRRLMMGMVASLGSCRDGRAGRRRYGSRGAGRQGFRGRRRRRGAFLGGGATGQA